MKSCETYNYCFWNVRKQMYVSLKPKINISFIMNAQFILMKKDLENRIPYLNQTNLKSCIKYQNEYI